MTALFNAPRQHFGVPAVMGQTKAHAARPAAETLVSVVLPCFGHLEFTRLCVPRLVQLSRKPVHFVFVDVGSLDGTAEYLEGFAAALGTSARVIRVQEELDLAGACQVGIEHAQGELIALVSNDSLVTGNWVNHLAALVNLTPEIGLVGCMSNLAPPPQWSGKLPYRLGSKHLVGSNGSKPDQKPVDDFAKTWREQHLGQSFEVERVGGSCAIFKAEVFKKIDLSNVQTPFGCIDGDLLSKKVVDAGYKLACCRDLFVHHFGSRLFIALRVDQTIVPPEKPS